MKKVKFNVINFKRNIPDNYHFFDRGYVNTLKEGVKSFLDELKLPSDDESIKKYGLENDTEEMSVRGTCLTIKDYPFEGSKIAATMYLQEEKGEDSIHYKAHEEGHAVCHLGLRSELEEEIENSEEMKKSALIKTLKNTHSNISELDEELFCELVGEYALRNYKIDPAPAYRAYFQRGVKTYFTPQETKIPFLVSKL